MSSALSERQKEELNKSILDYLKTSGFNEAYDALRVETDQAEFVPDPKAKWAGLLEKKWTSVIRLQKKIMDLEARNAQLLEELSTARLNPASTRNNADWLPRAPARHTLTGHRSPITRVAFHPLYTVCASASEDASIKVWDWESGEHERTLKGHTKAVQDCDYDSKGLFLVSCSSDLTIKLWDVSNDYSASKTFHGHDHSISCVRFLPGDAQFVSSGRDQTIRFWEVATGHCVRTISGHTDWVRSVIPSIDGRFLVSCSDDWTARIWEVSSGDTKMEFRGHDHRLEVAVFAPANAAPAIRELAGMAPEARELKDRAASAFIATGSRDKTIKIWDTQTGQCLKTLIGHDNWIRALAFHPTGKFLLSASDDKTVRIWDLATGRCTRTLEAHTHFVTCMSWGRTTVAGPVTNGAENGVVNGGPSAPKSEPRLVNVLATGSVDQSVKIWLP